MRDFPQELVYGLVFGVVWLAQLVYKSVRRKAAALQSDAEPIPIPMPMPGTEADIQAPPVPRRPDRPTLQARSAAPPKSVEAPWAAPAAVVARTVPPARPYVRRFSKAALMPGRRAVQDAVVIAAILQPCHAQRPHDAG